MKEIRKKTWEIVNNITGTSAHKTLEYSLIHNGEHINDSQQLANIFNTFFISVVEDLEVEQPVESNFNQLPCSQIFKYNIEKTSIVIDNTSELEVANIIQSLKHSNSSGSDGISAVILKRTCINVIKVLTYIINKSLSVGMFPDCLKEAVILPIFKKGSNLECSNYRPISLLPSVSKIIEKIIKKRVIGFYNKTDFFSSNQFGFRSGFSTEAALLNFITTVSGSINAGKKVSGLFLDIKKAFDTVDHKILLDKLYKSGIRGIALDWFESYLFNRRQRVRIEGNLSELGFLRSGVPQGSVLDPFYF